MWLSNMAIGEIDCQYEYSLPIVVNCQWIDEMNSSALGALVQIFKEVQGSGRSIALTGNHRARMTVKLVRLDDFLGWKNNPESAIYSVIKPI